MTVRRWDWLRLLLAVAGLGIMAYLTVVHYAGSNLLACPTTGVIDCHRVLTSPQSTFHGVPWSVSGIAWFVAAAVLAGVSLSRPVGEPPVLVNAAILWGMTGMAVVVYMIYLEAGVLRAICLWCTAAHVLIAAHLVLLVLTQPLRTPVEAGNLSPPP